MDWKKLLSSKRVSTGGGLQPSSVQRPRSPFERDWDRILFSTAFRRLHDKTQVFPLPDNDVVHSRLTHSLEVAAVGRSLGKHVGILLVERHSDLKEVIDFHEVGDVVAAACLAHDIGNPPFGHAGESAIAHFFSSASGADALRSMTETQRSDFLRFEGNAQGFRILTRLQSESDGGLKLTAATLGAYLKYPRASDGGLRIAENVATKKHGFFDHDVAAFHCVAEETGIDRCQARYAGPVIP
jgi:dGTPase